jgi:hypothetical protein
MAENRHGRQAEADPPVDLSRPEQRHERTDADASALTKSGIVLLLLCIATFAVAFAVFRYFEGKYGGVLPRAAQSMSMDARHSPPSPQLEVTETADLAAQRAAEQGILSTYGWVDREHGIVRIPIERAIEMLAARPLASRPSDGPVTAAGDVSVPMESGLGLKMQPAGGPLVSQIPDGPTPAAAALTAGGPNGVKQ